MSTQPTYTSVYIYHMFATSAAHLDLNGITLGHLVKKSINVMHTYSLLPPPLGLLGLFQPDMTPSWDTDMVKTSGGLLKGHMFWIFHICHSRQCTGSHLGWYLASSISGWFSLILFCPEWSPIDCDCTVSPTPEYILHRVSCYCSFSMMNSIKYTKSK